MAMFKKNKKRGNKNVASGAMADIAFLLLIYFLVSTTMKTDQGLSLKLPPEKDSKSATVSIPERNIFKVVANLENKILVENKPFVDENTLKQDLNKFILNYHADPTLSDNPEKAIVSLKMDRGSDYKTFIYLLDIIQGVYYDIYADRAGLTKEEFMGLDQNKPVERNTYLKARDGIPMNISIAEPTNSENNDTQIL